MRKPGVVLVLTATALVATVVPASASAADDSLTPYTAQQITWGNCAFTPDQTAKPARCAQITVPRDWANPGAGIDLKVSISRVAATGDRRGAILVNPGGPGGQGTSWVGALAGLEPSVNQLYDFIGMDPRGTGREGSDDNGFVCQVPTSRLPNETDLDARDRSARSIALHQQTPRAIAEACQSDAIAPYITTWQTAHDMDLIRVLLGEEKLNYLGYSYGTWLGAKYASLFPERAGKVVLDSSVNFEGRLQANFEAFPVIDQRQFDDVYLPWLARQFPDQLGRTAAEVKTKWGQVRAYYAAHGMAPDAFDRVFVGNGGENGWLNATLVFARGEAALDGRATRVPAALNGQLDARSRAAFGVGVAELTAAKVIASATALEEADYVRVPGTRLSVACGDQATHSAEWYKRLSDRQGPKYPLYGWEYGVSEVCGFWSERPQQELPTLPAQVAKNVLVVQGEFDPQTGYEQASEAARSAGVPLVSVDDSPFHGQYALSGNPCVDGLVNTFLTKDSRPGDTTCPGVPLPGEDQVFSVPGPVSGSHGVGRKLDDTSSGLRQSLHGLISRLNRWM